MAGGYHVGMPPTDDGATLRISPKLMLSLISMLAAGGIGGGSGSYLFSRNTADQVGKLSEEVMGMRYQIDAVLKQTTAIEPRVIRLEQEIIAANRDIAVMKAKGEPR